MSYKIEATPQFLIQAKKLAKKYPSIRNDIAALAEELTVNPFLGTPLGKGFHKVRLSVASKNKGKSGSARLITCVKVIRETIYLASIYDKSDKDTITDKELKALAKEIQRQ